MTAIQYCSPVVFVYSSIEDASYRCSKGFLLTPALQCLSCCHADISFAILPPSYCFFTHIEIRPSSTQDTYHFFATLIAEIPMQHHVQHTSLRVLLRVLYIVLAWSIAYPAYPIRRTQYTYALHTPLYGMIEISILNEIFNRAHLHCFSFYSAFWTYAPKNWKQCGRWIS